MKKVLLLGATLTVLIFTSCSKGGDGGGSAPVNNDDRPVLKLSKNTIVADGFDASMITVVDKNNNDITSQCAITVNNVFTSNLEFYTAVANTYNIRAKLGSRESLPLTLTASSPGISKYSQKVLAEDFTGAWCGYCPRVAYQLDQIHTTNSRVIPIAVHNADPMAHPQEGILRARWSINAWPTAMVNRKYEWNEQASVLTGETNKWSPLGLSIESAITGSTISGKVKTEFDITTSLPLVVCVMLVEDGTVYPQTSYYNGTTGSPFFGLGNPINNYVHNHILRKFGTAIFGDAVPAASQVKGTTYEKTYSIDASGYDLSKCSIVAFAGYGEGLPNRSGALNVQIVKAGFNQAFD